MNQPLERQTTKTAMTRLGRALLTTHIITSRATTPGAVSRPMNSLLAAATIGREIRWVNSRLVLMLDVPPNSTAEHDQHCRTQAALTVRGDHDRAR